MEAAPKGNINGPRRAVATAEKGSGRSGREGWWKWPNKGNSVSPIKATEKIKGGGERGYRQSS